MSRRSLRLLTFAALFSIVALVASASLGVNAQSKRSADRAIENASKAATAEDDLTRSSIEYAAARVAPGTDVDPGAFTAARLATTALPLVGGAWSEVTSKPYDSDAQGYRDPVFSNSGGGAGLVSGRMSALAIDGATVWAGAADGGVWKSTDGGAHWTATFDGQSSLSVGAIAVNAADHSVWVGTGENNTAFENYRGTGVYRSTNGGTTWALVGGSELNGTTIGKLTFDGVGGVYAATTRGLYKRAASDVTSAWTQLFDAATFGFARIPYGLSFVNDVVVKPNSNGKVVVANMAWRNGADYNGFYISRDGGATFARETLTGAIQDKDVGRSSLAYAADGSRLYAVVESISLFNALRQPNSGSVLMGVFVSTTGDPAGSWDRIANHAQLGASGSALQHFSGYHPGVQAWYNQFVGVDPNDVRHVYVGLEEVFESTNGGLDWTTPGPYWNFGFPCFAQGPDTCPKTTHPDQHAIAFTADRVFVGNDGGVWSRPLRNATGWSDLNATLRTLQYYYAGIGKVATGDAVWGGLQDNGESLLLPGATAMVSPFGGDGGDTLVDPNNGDRAVVEYVDLDMALTTNGGRSDGTTSAWIEMTPSCFAFTYTPSPCDPNARFIAPFRADGKSINHWVAGGQYVWDNQGKGWGTRCGSSSCDWKIVYDTGFSHSTTAISVSGAVTYAGWCGPFGCNPRQSSTTGGGFVRGVATNYGGTWHELSLSGLPNRYVSSLTIDPANAAHVYAVFGGFSRHWIPSGGVGHVFESTNGGATWADISGTPGDAGALPDAPGDDLVIAGSSLYLATDVGVFTATMAAPSSWSRFGSGLPNSAVNDLTLSPDSSYLLAATHGRGLWKISL